MRRDYITTHTGREVWLPGSDPDMIAIEDISHALSYSPRFAGHIDSFYSVAQHCINVALILPPEHRLQGLLHDATEAYLCDIPTPFKAMLANYKELEDDLWRSISTKFSVPYELHPDVKWADRVMLMTERDALKPNSPRWSEEYEATERSNHPNLVFSSMPHDDVEALFMGAFLRYSGR